MSNVLEKSTTIPSAIKDAAALLAGIAGLAYAVGFLIVTGLLISWGIADVTLVKARYIAVGLLFVVHIVAVIVAIHFLLRFVPRLSRLLRIPLAFIGGAVVAVVFLYAKAAATWQEQSGQFWQWLRENYDLLLIFWYTPVFLSAVVLRSLPTGTGGSRVHEFPVHVIALTLLLLTAMRTYTVRIYPRTPVAIGGGDFFLVRLMPSRDKPELLRMLLQRPVSSKDPNPLHTDNAETVKSPETPWVWLLDQTDHAYFVLILKVDCTSESDLDFENVRAVEVSKDLVSGILHYNRNFDASPCEAENTKHGVSEIK